jgi:hypothetical protein
MTNLSPAAQAVLDAIDYEDARDIIAEKYPNRKVIAVQGRKTPDELAQGLPKIPQDAL